MKSIIAFMLVVALPALAQTTIKEIRGDNPEPPLVAPKRLIDRKTVELMPLFDWWTNAVAYERFGAYGKVPKVGERPLKSWLHISGIIKSEGTGFWDMEVSIKEGPNDKAVKKVRILLYNPPIEAKQRHEQILAEAKAMRDEASRLSDQFPLPNRSESQKKQIDDLVSRSHSKARDAKKLAGLAPLNAFALARDKIVDGKRVFDFGLIVK